MCQLRHQAIFDKNTPAVDIHAALAEITSKSAKGGEACATVPVGKVRAIAGSFKGIKGPASTFNPVEPWDMSMSKIYCGFPQP